MENYDKIKKTLAVAFMHDLDANRPEGKMCLSNGECADIEKAFNEQDWSKLARYLDKYTESEDERHRKWILEYLYDGLRKSDEQFKDHFKSEIEWLEKQKEPKHAPDDLQKSFEEGQKSIISNPEKYGLCKRVEWSKSDKRALNLAISIINGEPISRCGNDLQECITRLKCIRDVLMTTPSELSMVEDGS